MGRGMHFAVLRKTKTEDKRNAIAVEVSEG
jgi:hypothetical protein